jgi:cytochrome c-type biogenesis protein CcmH
MSAMLASFTSFTSFTVGAACLAALGAWMLRPAWRAPALAAAGARKPAHLGILGDQLAALDRELAAGLLDVPQHALARRELQRRVLDESAAAEGAIATGNARSPATLALVTLAVPLFAAALYAAIGNPAGLSAQPLSDTAAAATATAAPTAPEPEVSPEAMQAMLATLAQRLEKPSADPATDLQGWTMLARSYAGLQRFADADRAYARAIALAPRDAQLIADRADVLAVLQGQRTAGEPERLIAEALRIDPRNIKALALAGSAAFERREFASAIGYWQQARELAPDGSAFAAGLDRSLVAAREAGGEVGAAAPANAAAADAANAATATATAAATAAAAPTAGIDATAARITGRVSLAPALAARAAPTDTVFVFARASEGSRMPLAIVRRTVADLPFDFTLDDSSAMSAQTRLSGASRVIVGARVSRSGSAMPQPGDLRGESGVIGVRGAAVALSIDAVQQ